MNYLLRILVLSCLLPGAAAALGLGNLDLESALNEPFAGKIQLLSASVEELDELNVSLADAEAFERAGVDRPFILSELRFKLVRSDNGADYIKVSSEQPIREPFLNFLVEVSWSNGRLYREYTVLLDPPMYDSEVNVAEIMALAPSAPASVVAPVDPGHQVVYGDDFDQYAGAASGQPSYTPAARTVDYSGGDYGPTGANDTLWSIASAMRPDASISVNQMMLALLQANPDAFVNNNVNGLKRGQILQMPSAAEMNAMSQADALAETKKQYAAWEQVKDKLAAAGVAERPETSSPSTTTTETATATADTAASEAELKLLSAADTSQSTEQVASVDGAGGSATDLILAEESIQALTRENLELKDQLQETEALINDLKRLLELKDDELAKLQAQLAEQEPEQEVVSEPDVAEPAEEVEEVPAEISEPVVTDDSTELAEPAAVEAPVAAVVEEEALEVLDIEPETASGGVMDMLAPYLGPVTDLVGGNPLYAIAALGLLVVLILIAVATRLKKAKSADTATEISADEFPGFEEEHDDSDLDAAQQALDSQEETILPGFEDEFESEDETIIAAEEDGDDNSEDETYLPDRSPQAVEATVAPDTVEENDEEDPLQEVNTYLAFEQFDQAEEFVRNAIKDKPDNPEFHTKLLEVFYTSGNKKAYEAEAKVLHELVGGAGEHWDMAVAMWSEMSPNRELFGEGDIDDDDSADNTGGGFVDVTSDVEAGDNENTLDFDIGADASDQNAADVLDVTAVDEGEDILDVTASDNSLDFSEEPTMDSSINEADDLLDVTAIGSVGDGIDDDILDVSNKGANSATKLESTSAENSDEDALDLSASSDLELDSDDDLLDLTAASSASADSDQLLDLDIEDTAAETQAASSNSDNVIDFDTGTAENSFSLDMDNSDDADDDLDAGLELDLGAEDDSSEDDAIPDTIAEDGLELSLTGEDLSDNDEPIRLDSDTDSDIPSLDLDINSSDDADDSSLEFTSAEKGDDSNSLDFDLALDDEIADSGADEGSSTLELEPPAIDFDDEEDDSTVFVPRSAKAEEQSIEDEIATKLDLAKAYVELGDKDSAKTILDEVMADGNDEQKQQAQDLLGQV